VIDMDDRLHEVPLGRGRDVLSIALDAFDAVYGGDIVLEEVEYLGPVRDVAAVAEDMTTNFAVVDVDGPGGQATLGDADDVRAVVPDDDERWEVFRRSLRANLAREDHLLLLHLRDLTAGRGVVSLESVRPDGTAFSGGLFLTSALPGGPTLAVSRPNPGVCKTFVLATYIFTDIPKIAIEVCVQAVCEGATVVDCLLLSARATKLGPAAEVELHPQPQTGVPPKGLISGKCCFGTVAYGWATGFKNVKVSADGKSFEIEGRWGRGDTGFVTVSDCCGEAAPAPPPPVGALPRPVKPTVAPSGVAPVTTGTTTTAAGGKKGGITIITADGTAVTVGPPPAELGEEPPAARPTCESVFPRVSRCSELGPAYKFDSEAAVLSDLAAKLRVDAADLEARNERPASAGPCAGEPGAHHYSVWNTRTKRYTGESIAVCRCCKDTPDGPKLVLRWRHFR
jgi:hypothetical protein